MTAHRNLAITAVTIAIALSYVALCIIEAWSAHAASSLDERGLRRAVTLQPYNSSYWRLWGRYDLFVNQDAAGARCALWQAVNETPSESRGWLDLALACRAEEDGACEQYAIREALLYDPNTPSVAWEAGNYYLTRGDIDEALAQFRAVAASPNEFLQPAISVVWRETDSVDRALKYIPPSTGTYTVLIDLLVASRNENALREFTKKWGGVGKQLKREELVKVADVLLNNGDVDDAQNVWNQASESYSDLARVPGNLLVNGDFEKELVPNGFGWNITHLPAINIEKDASAFSSGSQSLRIDLRGAIPPMLISQQVPVKRRHSYRLTYAWRSDSLQDASPLRVVVQDQGGVTLIDGELLSTNTEWLKGKLQFDSGNSDVVRVSFIQPIPWSIATGRLWIDSLSLAEVQK